MDNKVLYLHPSANLGKWAADKQKAMPLLLRYVMNGFGTYKQAGDLLSFLLFEKPYCEKLIALGYQDALLQKIQIERFFTD